MAATPALAMRGHRSQYSPWITGVMASGRYLAARPVSSATRTGARRLMTMPSSATRSSASIVRSRASILANRAASASIWAWTSARRSFSMPRSSSALTFSASTVRTCSRVKPRSFSAMTRLSSASWLAS